MFEIPSLRIEDSPESFNILDWIDPLKYFSSGEYIAFWQNLFATVLQGFWARFLALSFIIFAFYLGVRRQRFQMGLWFIFMAAFIIYGGAFLRLLGLM